MLFSSKFVARCLHGVSYDSIGNIVKKVGLCASVGCMQYSDPNHAHAVSSVTTQSGINYVGLHAANLVYDANGNMTCVVASPATVCGAGDAKDIAYTAFNMTSLVTMGTQSVGLTYTPEHERIQQVSTGGSGTVTTTYLNDPASNVMTEGLHQTGQSSWKTYIVADGHIVAQRLTVNGKTPVTMNYFTLDHLGSVAVITDGTGAVISGGRQYYDAWGAMRNANGSSDTTCTLPGALTNLTRGFANQEQMASVCLINMNARLYDAALGRFLSPDPTVEAPYDLQDLNRYAYVGNNPLSLTDPSGLCFLGCFWHSSLFKAAANIVISWALAYIGLPYAETELGIADEIDDAAVFNTILGAGIAGYVTTGKLSGALASGAQAEFFHAAGTSWRPTPTPCWARRQPTPSWCTGSSAA